MWGIFLKGVLIQQHVKHIIGNKEDQMEVILIFMSFISKFKYMLRCFPFKNNVGHSDWYLL